MTTKEFSNSNRKSEKSILKSRRSVRATRSSIPQWVRDEFPDLFLRFFRDEPARINYALELGYTFIDPKQHPQIAAAIGDKDLGSEQKRGSNVIARTGKLGTRKVLMGVDIEQHRHYRQEIEEESKKNESGSQHHLGSLKVKEQNTFTKHGDVQQNFFE